MSRHPPLWNQVHFKELIQEQRTAHLLANGFHETIK